MRELTKDEALMIIEQFNEDNYLGNGSSRATYKITFEEKTYAAKVGLDKGGVFQNKRELKIYNEYSEEGILVPIYYYYKDILIIEECLDAFIDYEAAEDIDNYDLNIEEDIDYLICNYNYSFRSDEEFINNYIAPLKDIIRFLEEIQGVTNDNYQIGLKNNKFYVYDFGYTRFVSRWQQVGEVIEYLGHINALCKMIIAEEIESGLSATKYLEYCSANM